MMSTCTHHPTRPSTLRRSAAVVSWLLVLAAGCGNDSGTEPAGTNAAATQFAAQLVDNLNEQPVPGMVVKVLDNDTGEELGFETTSASPDGRVTFDELPGDKVAFVVVGRPTESIDTYQYNIDTHASSETLWIVAKSAAVLAPGLANYQPDPTKAAVAGALYWVNGDGVEEPIGCATIRFEGDGGDIRYFGDNNLPTRDTPSPTDPGAAYRTASNPLNGRYFVGNAPTGMQTVTLLIDGQPAGNTTLVLFPRAQSSDKQDSICISNIYAVGLDKNPTPADCK